tara:strand:+ start:94794 stop:95237 length:444 start_codon:yes stop_codon:yes gene_type:complete
MGIYTEQDVGTNLEGDITLSTKGDLELADPLNTYKSVANFLLRTDFGDYAPNESIGCNLGIFIGDLNTPENREHMQYNIDRVLQERIFSMADVESTVVPFDLNEVLCVTNIGGSYLLDGTIQTIKGETLTYTFPYIDGTHITPITID